SRLQTICNHSDQFFVWAKELFIRFAERTAVNFKKIATRSIDSHRKPRAVEGDQAGRQTGHDAFTEFFRRIRALSRLGAELFECLSLLLKLRDDRLKRLEHKLGFVLRFDLIGNRSALCFADELVI